ncbi:hypothetical protein BSL78_15133 [Apostichopus japonicus]|uniref:DNA-directed DNA polymerase n=1 Tax=Stichopus japonicus TaxID=307972 RepID=A0A2G8KJ35_STIJA|nr:hypothetical protein BSL78_15133 [Apostichopus japonicus]
MGRKVEDGAKTGRKDEADNNGEGSNNEMEMETDQSKPQGVRHRVVNLGEGCKEQIGSMSKKGVVVKDINDKSQRSKVGKDQQATQERMDLGKTSSGTGSHFPRKNSGLKVKDCPLVHQQSVLVENERNIPVQSKTKFVPYGKGGVKDRGAVMQICVEEKTCEKVDKEGGHVAVSRDVNKAEVRNQFNKNKSGSAEMKNRNGKTQLTDKVERKLTVDEDKYKDDDDREDGKRDGYVGNTRELRVQRPTRNNSNIQKEQKSTRGQGLPLTISGGNCGTTEHKGSVKGERYSNQFSRVNKVGQETTVKGDSRDEMKTDEVEESQVREEAEEEEDVCGMDAAAKEEESKVKNGSCPKEYSFLFSPIDSHLEDFLENYDSQQDIIAISASPELKGEKKLVERQVRTSFGIGKTNKHLSKPAIEFNGGREPQTKDALIGHSLGQCKDRRKDLDQDPENKVGKILNLGEASSKCSSHFTKHKRDNFNSASQPKDIVSQDLIPAGRENVEKCSISDPVLSDNFLEETSECLSPGTLAVLDFLVDGDGEEVTFTQVNSPTNSESPDLFSEDPDLQLKDPVRRHGDDLGKSKLERHLYGKVGIEEKKHSKDRRLQWKCGNSVKVPQRGSSLSTAMQKDVDTCKADTPNRNVRKRKSDEKLPGKESGAIKRVSRCHSLNRSKVNSTSGTPSAPPTRSDSLPRTPSKGTKTPLPFLNSGVMRSSSRRPCRRSQISSAASSSSSKGKAMLSFNFETPTDVDIETVSSECDDLDVAMDSEDLDIELEPSQPEEPSHLANLATKSASRREQSGKKVSSQMDEIDIDSDISLSEVEGNVHFQDDRQCRRRRDCQKYPEATSSKRNKQLNDHEIGHLADNLQAGEISETRREKTSSTVRNEIDLNQTADQPRSQLSILESPIAPSTPDTFAIIDVCANKDLFETFIREWKRKKRYAFSIGCERYEVPVEGGGIGGNHRRGKRLGPEVDGLPLGWNKLLVTGLAVSWGAKDAYYISFQEKNVKVDLDASLAAPPNDESISVNKRIQEVTSTLELATISKGSQRSTIHRVAFDIKEQLKILVQLFGCVFSGIIEDPKVAHWLLDPSAKEKNLHGMISQYLPTQAGILDNIGGGIGLSSLGISPQNPGSPRLRACVESVLLLDLMESLKKGLTDNHLLDAFRKIEMPSIMTLTHVELNGFGFNPDECETQKIFMQSKLSALEEQAYLLAGRSFSLTSPEDIAQVLFMELKLPPNGDVVGCNQGRVTMPPRKTLGVEEGEDYQSSLVLRKNPWRKSDIFIHCQNVCHCFFIPSGLISEWRKMSMSLTKVVFPLQKEKVFNEKLGMYRLFTVYQTHTATGRVATLDPNIQAIPKDFEISLPSVIGESPPHWSGPILGGPATATKGKARRESRRSSVQCKMTLKEPEGLKSAVSLRHAFCPFPGGLLLAADYSQLELRILAHLSQDVKLIRILNADGDVFRQIAAQWKNIEERDVTDKQRQEAKQICYGMIYGIGAKALGEQLEIEEEDAACFMETFRDQYKGMKNFIKQTVVKCRERGFVETLSKRRRYLPSINHSNLGARNHAERQAVNTTIQGSAADLVKTAMVQLQQQLSLSFPSTRISHRHKDKGKIGLPKCRTRHSQNTRGSVRGAYLVLQLHDELIYEVHKDDLEKVVTLVRKVMESAMRLLVKLPVKIKVGPTWGSLKEI